MSTNEEIACQALIQLVFRKTRKCYQIDERPDKRNSVTKDIDFLLSCPKCPPIAVEHTTVESFEGQRAISPIHASFVSNVAVHLRLPADTYFKLCLPIGLYQNVDRSIRDKLVDVIVPWIERTMGTLQPFKTMSSMPLLEGKYTAWLGRGGSAASLNGRLLPALIAPQNLEDSREERISRALATKLPKLSNYATQGFLTYLILEDQDMALGNSEIIKNAVLKARGSQQSDFPYAIVLFTIYGTEVAEGWFIKYKDKWASRIYKPGPFYDFKQT